MEDDIFFGLVVFLFTLGLAGIIFLFFSVVEPSIGFGFSIVERLIIRRRRRRNRLRRMIF